MTEFLDHALPKAGASVHREPLDFRSALNMAQDAGALRACLEGALRDVERIRVTGHAGEREGACLRLEDEMRRVLTTLNSPSQDPKLYGFKE